MELTITVEPNQRSPLQIITAIKEQLDALKKRQAINSYTIAVCHIQHLHQREFAILHSEGLDEEEETD